MGAEGSNIRYAAFAILLIISAMGVLDDRYTTSVRWAHGMIMALTALALGHAAFKTWRTKADR